MAGDFMEGQQHYYAKLRLHRQDLNKFQASRDEHLAAAQLLNELPKKVRSHPAAECPCTSTRRRPAPPGSEQVALAAWFRTSAGAVSESHMIQCRLCSAKRRGRRQCPDFPVRAIPRRRDTVSWCLSGRWPLCPESWCTRTRCSCSLATTGG